MPGSFLRELGVAHPIILAPMAGAGGTPELVAAVSTYANEKGNLRFPIDQRIPYALITRIVKARVRENLERASARKRKC